MRVDSRPNGGAGRAVVVIMIAIGAFAMLASSAAAQVAGTPEPTVSAVETPLATPTTEASPVATEVPPLQEGDVDTQALLIAVAVGLVAAAFIYGFWVLVRPKPGERVDYLGNPIDPPATPPDEPESHAPSERD